MAVLWCLLIMAVFGGGFFVLYKQLRIRHFAGDEQLAKNQKVIEEEIETRIQMLRELAHLSLGFISPEQYIKIEEGITAAEEELRSERGRITITEAEIEAVDTRLRDLEELRRELEMSNIDASREVELLKSQEKELQTNNEALQERLSETLSNVRLLKSALESNPVASESLEEVQQRIQALEEKIRFYQESISSVNEKYVLLKRAYDALDIEYAQLYEKQQAAGR